MTNATISPRSARTGTGLIGRVRSSTSVERAVLGLLGLVVIGAAWQAFVSSGIVDPLVFPTPARTAEALADLIVTGEIFPHLAASGFLFAVGLTVAILIGVPLGFLAGWFPTVRGLLNPHVALLYSMPSIALMPLFIVWLGFGFASQFLVVVLFAVFPPYYAALQSVANADQGLLRVARTFGSGDARLFRSIILPGSVPVLLSGIRFAVGKAIAAVILAELYASTVGLGYLLNLSGLQFKTARVFAIVMVLAAAGVLTSFVLRWAEDHFDVWRPQRLGDM